MELGPQQFGRWLLLLAALLAASGIILIGLGKLGFFRLPGDLEFGSKNWRVYVPAASCIIISVVLTAILWIISYLRR
jgi:hypothetical protein